MSDESSAVNRVVVIGASAGGVEALLQIARELPADFPAAIFVVLHIPADTPSVLPRILNRASKLHAIGAEDGLRIQPGHIYTGCPDQHLIVHRGVMRLSRGPKENGHRPAIDVLFRSAALAYGRRAVGVVLSGNLADGSAGLVAIKRREGVAIVQDPDDAIYPSMPTSAIQHVEPDHVVPVSQIAALLADLAHAPLSGAEEQSMADDLEYENEIAEEGVDEEKSEHAKRGRAAGFGCPDCGGALWEISDGNLVRFRCRVGHAWTAENLLAEQAATLEQAMWTAVRALEESASLARQMARRLSKQGQNGSSERFERRAERTEQQAQLLRRVLVEDVSAPREPLGSLQQRRVEGMSD